MSLFNPETVCYRDPCKLAEGHRSSTSQQNTVNQHRSIFLLSD